MAPRPLLVCLVLAGLVGGPPAPAPAVAAAAERTLQPPPVPLPPAVARTRESILKLALAGRYEALEALGKRTKPFTYHFGFEKRKPAAYWRGEARLGQDPLPKLAAIVRLPYVLDEGIYTWPAAAGPNPTPADWEALKAVYPAAKVARYRADGYTGWRAGIDARGAWVFFVRGD
jgi:hypothetical protein